MLGLEKGKRLIDSLPNTEAYFIYAGRDGKFKSMQTNGFVCEAIED